MCLYNTVSVTVDGMSLMPLLTVKVILWQTALAVVESSMMPVETNDPQQVRPNLKNKILGLQYSDYLASLNKRFHSTANP